MASSSTTFPLAQLGSLTVGASASPGPVPQGFVVTNVRKIERQDRRTVTGSRDVSGTWTQDTNHQYVHGVPVDEWRLDGFVENAVDYESVQSSSVTLQTGNLIMQVTRLRLHKRWRLVNVTGSPSGDEAEWKWGIPEYGISGNGWATGASGPGFGTQEEKVTITADDIGTIEWNTSASAGKNDGKLMKLDTTVVEGSHSEGGPIGVRFRGAAQGAVTYNSGTTDWSWLFAQTGGNEDPQKVDLTWDTNGQSETHSTLFYDVVLEWPFVRGGSTSFRASARFDKS